jgi:hypothetical protein
MEDHQVNVIVVKEEGSKSSNAINLLELEDHVNVGRSCECCEGRIKIL